MLDWCIWEGCQQQLDLDVVVSTTHILKFSFKSCNLHKKSNIYVFMFQNQIQLPRTKLQRTDLFWEWKKIITAYAKEFWSSKQFLLFQNWILIILILRLLKCFIHFHLSQSVWWLCHQSWIHFDNLGLSNIFWIKPKRVDSKLRKKLH